MYPTKMKMKGKESGLFQFHLFLLLITIQAQISSELDAIYPGQSLSGNDTILSEGGIFEMGFFSPAANSQKYYIGIWYKGLPMPEKTVVWVANRDHPVSDPTSASLEFGEDGNLVLLSPSGEIIWSTNGSSVTPLPNATVGVIGDDGNFVLKDGNFSFGERLNSSSILWQSFDHPTDTFLPGAHFDYSTVLTAWKNTNDPAFGTYIAHKCYYADKIRVEQRDGSENFTNLYVLHSNSFIEVEYSQEMSVSFSVSQHYQSGLFRFVMNVNGQLKLFGWWNGMKHWKSILLIPQPSDIPCFCGQFAICDLKNPSVCHCIEGFVPIDPKGWNIGINDCTRRTNLSCFNSPKDKFFVIHDIRYPPTPQLPKANSIGECRLACLEDCSCTAYAYYEQCLTWKGAISNIQELSSVAEIGGDFYVRIAASETEDNENKSHTRMSILISLLGIGVVVMLIIMWRKLRGCGGSLEAIGDTLMHFNHRVLKKATRNFTRKLGEGGFSTVYKGEFPNSTLVAVKQLKGQMYEEKQLRAEVSTIGIIQHRNLVRLRGFCLEGSKKYLVYDYMPNSSLEFHLFKKSNGILDWAKRFNIALGTAKGLAYLHESCRDCIIHCDIKPENILLDADFDPKVADFGLAKLLGRNFSRVLTTMRGTRGYLAPEWFSGEAITAKVDVYSYGHVLFEIISGRRNMDLSNDELSNYFPVLVFNTLNSGEEVVRLADPKLEGEVDVEELTRACKVACWCIQDHEQDEKYTWGE